MTKLLQASALVGLLIFLAACGDESTPVGEVTVSPTLAPTETPLPIAAPEPTPTAWPTATPTLAPTRPSIPRPTKTPILAATSSPTPPVPSLKIDIDDDTTWRELLDTLTGSERGCMETKLGEDLERLLDSRVLGDYISQDHEFQTFSCLNPETARDFFVAAVLSDLPLEIDLAGSEISCIQELVADKDIAAIWALSESGEPDESVMLELSVGVMLCIPDLLMAFVGIDPSLLSEGEFDCVRAVFRNIDAETLAAWVVPDPHEVPAKALEFAQSLEACAPDLFEGEHRSEEARFEDNHSDDPEGATPMGLREEMYGTIGDHLDLDFFVFEAVEGGEYLISGAPAEAGTPDSVLGMDVYHPGLALDYNLDVDEGGVASIFFVAPETGSYYVSMSASFTERPVPYLLYIDQSAGEYTSDDHSDSPRLATPVQLEEIVSGMVDHESDYDYFIFKAVEGATYMISIAQGSDISGFNLITEMWHPDPELPLDFTFDLDESSVMAIAFVAPKGDSYYNTVSLALNEPPIPYTLQVTESK